MIHDFAKLPRTYELHAPVRPPVKPRFRRRYLLALVLAVSIAGMVWHQFDAVPAAQPEFIPGQNESRDYQTAIEQEATDDTTSRSTHTVALQSARPVAVAATPKQAKPVSVKKEKTGSEKSQFGFYDNLTHSTWSVPVLRGVYVSDADRKRMENQRYMLQAASVREVSDAQRLVQRLREAGLAATYTTSEQGGWNRVNVGPFENVSMMNKAEDILVRLGMMPIIRKIP